MYSFGGIFVTHAQSRELGAPVDVPLTSRETARMHSFGGIFVTHAQSRELGAPVDVPLTPPRYLLRSRLVSMPGGGSLPGSA